MLKSCIEPSYLRIPIVRGYALHLRVVYGAQRGEPGGGIRKMEQRPDVTHMLEC